MRPIISVSVCVLICGTPSAFAAEDPARTTDPTQVQSTSAPEPSAPTAASPLPTTASSSTATPPSAAVSPATTTHVSKGTSDLTDTEKHLIATGYKLQVGKDGRHNFCRRETPLGSHFETKTCGTAEQLAESSQNSKYLTDKILRMDNNPAPKLP